MATKITILGQEPKRGKKPIEFKKGFLIDGSATFNASDTPKEYENVVLLSLNYSGQGLDLMFAYDDNKKHEGGVYLGHFNDGIV